MLAIALLGSVIAGTYGVLHDQITYTVSPEYFTKFKIHQFQYLGVESGMRVLAAKIGFLATWWVGFFAGWFMGRVLVPRIGFRPTLSFSLKGFLLFFVRVACIHNAGYLGAFLGLIVALVWAHKVSRTITESI